MRKPKFVIFDCDGVLVDSEILANRVEVEVKNKLGFPITLEEQIKKFVACGMNHPMMYDRLWVFGRRAHLSWARRSLTKSRC